MRLKKSFLVAAAVLVAFAPTRAATYLADGTAALPTGINATDFTLADGESLDIDALQADGYDLTIPGFFRLDGKIDAGFATNVITKTGDGLAIIASLPATPSILNGTINVTAGGLGILGSSLDASSTAQINVSAGATFGALGINNPTLGTITINGTGGFGAALVTADTYGASVLGDVVLAGNSSISADVNAALTVDQLDLAGFDLQLEAASAFTATNTLNAGDITADGTGGMTLGALSLAAGSTVTVNGGTLAFTYAFSDSTNNLVVKQGATLALGSAGGTFGNLTTTAGTSGVATVQLAGDVDLGDVILGAATRIESSEGLQQLGTGKVLDLVGHDLTINTATDGSFFTEATQDTGAATTATLTKSGTGIAVLGTTTLAAGNILSVQAGILALGDATNTAATINVADGSSLVLAGVTNTVSGTITINGFGADPDFYNAALFIVGETISLTTLNLGSNAKVIIGDGSVANVATATTLGLGGFNADLDVGDTASFTATTTTGAAGITKNGLGSANLGALTFGTGASVTLSAGTLAAGAVDLVDNDLTLDVADTLTFSATTTTAAGNITKNGIGSANLGDLTIGAATAETFEVNGGTLTVGALDLNESSLTIRGLGDFTATSTTNSYDITKEGAGTASLGAVTFFGNATVSFQAGTLNLLTLDLAGNSLTVDVANGLTLTPMGVTNFVDLTKDGEGTADVGALTLTAASTITLNAGALDITSLDLAGFDVTFDVADTLTLAPGAVTNFADVTKDGLGTADLGSVTLVAASTFTSNAGTLSATVGGLTQAGFALELAGAGTISFSQSSLDAAVTKNGAGTASLGVVTLGADVTLTVNDGQLNAISTAGTFNLTKDGVGSSNLGAFTLDAAKTLTVNAGTAILGTGTNSSSAITVNNGGTLEIGVNSSDSVALGGNVTISGTGAVSSLGAFVNHNDNIALGTLELGAAATVHMGVVEDDISVTTLKLAGFTLTLDGAGRLSAASTESTGAVNVILNGSADGYDSSLGNVTLNGASTFTVNGVADLKADTLTLNGNTLELAGAGDFTAVTTAANANITKNGAGTADLGDLTLGAALTLTSNEGSLNAVTLTQGGFALELAGAGAFDVGASTLDAAVTKNGAGTADLGDITLANNVTLTVNDGKIDAASTTGNFNLTKEGTALAKLGDFSIGGANTLAINAGVAEVNNLTNSGATVTIANGATLSLDSGSSTGTAQLTGNLSIAGTGAAGQGGAIVSVQGINTLGKITQTAASTIKVSADSLTTGDLAGAFDLTLDVVSAATPTAFTSGKTTTVETIIKNGAGTASLGTVDTALSTVTVNAGILEFLGTSSTSGTDHGALLKNGVGELQIKNTTHYYGNTDATDFQIDAGTVTVVAGATLNAQVSVAAGAVFDVQAGAFHIGNLITSGDPSDIIGTMTGNLTLNDAADQNVTSTGAVNGNITVNDNGVLSNFGTTTGDTIDINDNGFFNVENGGVTQGDTQAVEITLRDNGTLQVIGGGQVFGNVDAGNNSQADIFGELTGGIDVTGDADLTIRAGGSVDGEVTVAGDNQVDADDTFAQIAGTLNGNLTLTNDATATVGVGGTLNGNLTGRNTSDAFVLGAMTGDVGLSSTAFLELAATGSIIGNASITQSAELDLAGTFTGDLAAKNTTLSTLRGTALLTGDIDLTQSAILVTEAGSSVIGELIAQNATDATIGGSLTGDIGLSDTAFLDVTADGAVTGNLGMVDSTAADIDGELTGDVTMADGAQLDLFTGGILTGNLSLSDSADARLAGDATGDVSLINTSTLTVNGSGSLTGDVTAINGTTVTVVAGGTLDGVLTASDTVVVAIAGDATGNATLNDTASLNLAAGGTLVGDLTANNDASAAVSGDLTGAVNLGDTSSVSVTGIGSITGDVTLADDAEINVAAGGTLDGDLTASSTSNAAIAGAATGDATLSDDAQLVVSGSLTGNLTANNRTFFQIAPLATLDGDLAMSGTSLGTINGIATGDGALTGDSTLNVFGTLSGTSFTVAGTSNVTVIGTGKIQGIGLGFNATTLTDSATLVIDTLATFTSSLTAGNTTVATIAGTANGAVTLTGDADLNVNAPGSLTGTITASGTSSADIDGASTGAVTLSGDAALTLGGTGTLIGTITASGSSTAVITGTATGASSLSGDANITVTATGVLNGASTLAGTSNLSVSGDLNGDLTAGDDSTATIDATGEATGNATLNDDAILTVVAGGLLTGNLDGNNGSSASIAGTLAGNLDLANIATAIVSGTANGTGALADDSLLTVSGTLAGASLSASGTSDISVTATGTVKGAGLGSNATTLTDSATLTVASGGTFKSSLTASNTAIASVSGAATGNATLNNGATLTVVSGGSLTGNLDGNNGSISTIAGTLLGTIDLADTSVATVSGTSTGAATLVGDTDLFVTSTGTLNGALSVSGTSGASVSGAATGNATLNNTATLTVVSGGSLTGNLDANNGTTTTVAGTLTGNLDLADTATASVSGTANGSGTLAGDSALTVTGTLAGATLVAGGTSDILVSGATGKIQGVGAGSNALTLNNTATLTVDNSAGTIKGSLTANGSSLSTLKGTITGNVGINDSATLTGTGTTGTIVGNLTQTGGTVAPGNSPGILNVVGNYALSAGTLQIELGGTAGPGVNPNGHDQLAVTGTVTLSGTANLEVASFGGFEASRTEVFQAITSSDGNATRGTFDSLNLSAAKRVLFDHSSGKAYGTGLSGAQTFAAYATNANQQAIAAALYAEAVVDDSFILTTGGAGVQVATDLGSAVVTLLTTADTASALDALSPEAYAGIAELGARSARSFSQISSTKRRHATASEWDYSVGYNGEQITTSSSSSSFTNYKLSTNEFNVTASRDLAPDARLTLAIGTIDGTVSASGFRADTDTQAIGAGFTLLPASKGYAVDLGIAALRTDWDATRSGAATSADGQDGLGLSFRVTRAATVDGALSYSPYIGVSYAKQEQSAVAETAAAGGAGVGFAAYDRKSVVGELGLKAEYALQPGTTLTGVAALEHEFKNDGSTTLDAEFTETGAANPRFDVTSKGLGTDIIRLGVGLRTSLGENSSFSLSYDALISSHSESGQAVRADVSFRF